LTFVHEIYDWVPKIPTLWSLGVIGGVLLVATIASLIKAKQDPTARAHAGRVTSGKTREDEPKE
ncbi:MAG: TerC family protein, partial [Candidatus Nanopelagicales bacterium]